VFKRIDNRPLLLLEFAQPPSCVYSLRWKPTAADGAEHHHRYRGPPHDLGRHSGPQDMTPAALAMGPKQDQVHLLIPRHSDDFLGRLANGNQAAKPLRTA
jgi:hypothetical protein